MERGILQFAAIHPGTGPTFRTVVAFRWGPIGRALIHSRPQIESKREGLGNRIDSLWRTPFLTGDLFTDNETSIFENFQMFHDCLL